VPPPPSKPPGTRLIFVSTTKVAGGFATSMRSGMDTACQSEAVAAFGGGIFFKSLAATTGFSASSQVSVTGTWVRPDFIAVGDQAALFNNGPLQTGINQHADGSYVGGQLSPAWTGATTPTATPANGNDDCSDWTANTGPTTGRASVVGLAGTGYFSVSPPQGCGNGAPFYCIQYSP
jgi:hypothetical protein